MTPPAIRSATTRDAVALAGLRYEFRSEIDPVAETKAAFGRSTAVLALAPPCSTPASANARPRQWTR
jgi:hypothetical protein